MNNNILSRVKRGIIARPQRVVIYGVESVGKTTLAAKTESPVILDIEGGSTHIDVPRLEIRAWPEIETAITELAGGGHEFKTAIVDSMDWAEKLAIEDMLARDKKDSLEAYGYGKGYVQAAERMARFLGSLDRLLESGLNVCLIAHAKVVKFEPPDGMAAYDRYELKMTRHTSPLVKEWADSLLFANFKTRVVESDSGKAKGIGGKERIIYTQRTAAYDAKCRVPAVAEEIPMTWEAVKAVFGAPSQATKAPAANPEQQTPSTQPGIADHAAGIPQELLIAFLVDRGVLKPGQTLADVPDTYTARVATNPDGFRRSISQWADTQEAVA